MSGFMLRLYLADDAAEETVCTSLVLEREIYTPYSEMTAVFLAEEIRYDNVLRIGLVWEDCEIFLGLADRVEQFMQGGVRFVRVKARSFGALLVQNELEQGLHANLTIGQLVQGFYEFKHLTYQDDDRTGYIFVRDGTSLWDCIVHFGYKLTGKHPYAAENEIRLTLPEDATVHTVGEAVSFGTVYDTTKLVSHYHMEDIAGNPNVYEEENQAAIGAEIVRNKQISFDQQYLSEPGKALSFRNKFSQRGWKAKFVEYAGFENEMLGDRVSFGQFLENGVVCRVRFSFGRSGWRTRLWVYEDGFYANQ